MGGLLLGFAVTFVVLRFLPKPYVPKLKGEIAALPGALLPEDSGAIDELLFMYVPELEPLVADSYEDFLTALDPSTRLVAVVPKGAGASLDKYLLSIDRAGGLLRRTHAVEVAGPITVWSKDRALVVAPPAGGGKTSLLIPVPPDPRWKERTNDWATLAAVATEAPERYFVRELPLEFDAGDFAVTRDKVLVDINLFTKNAGRGIASPAELVKRLEALFARAVVMLGEKDGDVPRHHMSMYMTPLGDHTVLVGDPRAAMAVVGPQFVPGEINPDDGMPLRADFSDALLARYDLAARELGAAGYRVERIPTVAFDDKTYIAYTNGVYETRGARRIAYVPQYGIAGLDDPARAVYARLGWEVRPVRVRAAYRFHGTIGCLANVLARTEP